MASKIFITLSALLVSASACPFGCGAPFLPPVVPPCAPIGIPPCAPIGIPPCVRPTQTFRVALDNCGPAPLPLAPVNAPPQQAPTIDRGIVPLPAFVPAPRTISNIARCVKTIVKPQPINQLVSLPAVQRFVQTSHTPVVETINYEGVPINCPEGLFPTLGLPGIAPCGIPAPIVPSFLPSCAPVLPPVLPPCLPAVPPCF